MLSLLLHVCLLLPLFQPATSLVLLNPCCAVVLHTPASFPPYKSDVGYGGRLVMPKVYNACSPILENLNNSIALVERGNCNFADKILNCQAAGAVGVVVMNYHPDTEQPLISMAAPDDGSATRITIPSVFISNEDGQELNKTLHKYPIVEVMINKTAELTLMSADEYLSRAFWNMLMVFFEIFLLIWGGFAVAIFISWSREKYASKARYRKVRDLPTREWGGLTSGASAEAAFDCTSCVICLDDFKEGDKVRTLPCNHEFHTACIDVWLIEKSPLCPICKRTIFPQEIVMSEMNHYQSVDTMEGVNFQDQNSRRTLWGRVRLWYQERRRASLRSNCITITTTFIVFVTLGTFIALIQHMNTDP